MRKTLGIALAAAIGFSCSSAMAGTDKIETAGKIIGYGLPVFAGGMTLYRSDYTGLAQLGVTAIGTIGIAYGLSHLVRERRPDGSDYHSFPSDTTAAAFTGADFLWARYGWQWGVPAVALASFTAYSRVEAHKHHWYDTVASAGLALGVNYVLVTRYHPRSNYDVSFGATPDSVGVHATYRW